jgi:uncharacterized membrane protein
MDTPRRSWVKSITWRAIGVVILGAISYAVTRDLGAVTLITLAFHGIRLILYYWHERLWERVTWGRIRHPLEHFCMKQNLTAADMDEIRVLLEERGYVAKHPEYEI